MSSAIGSKAADSSNMSGMGFREFKKQASFFLKEKIKTARLALTDVTPAQLLAEEATSGGNPDAKTMGMISRAAFEVDDYWRIVDILHTRLSRFDRTNWRVCYKALLILEHLLTHGPESVAEEFQSDRNAIRDMENFQYIDEKGFNWGLTVRKKSERVQTLLERGALLKEERHNARKISRGIQGFGRANREEDVRPIQILEATPSPMKENAMPEEELFPGKLNKLESTRELNPLLGSGGEKKKARLVEEDHPFNEQLSAASLL